MKWTIKGGPEFSKGWTWVYLCQIQDIDQDLGQPEGKAYTREKGRMNLAYSQYTENMVPTTLESSYQDTAENKIILVWKVFKTIFRMRIRNASEKDPKELY